MATIQKIKTAGPTAGDLDLLQKETDDLVDRGADAILIGCTEFSLISAELSAQVQIVDAMDVLVKAVLVFSGVTCSDPDDRKTESGPSGNWPL